MDKTLFFRLVVIASGLVSALGCGVLVASEVDYTPPQQLLLQQQMAAGSGGMASATGNTAGAGSDDKQAMAPAMEDFGPNRYRCPTERPRKIYGLALNAPSQLRSDETWTPDNVYLVSGALDVGAHTLTILAGTVVCFSFQQLNSRLGEPSTGELIVGEHGTLRILGTPGRHVVFTQNGMPSVYWSGISFKSGFSSETTARWLDMYNAGLGAGTAPVRTFDGDGDPPLDLQHVTLYSVQARGPELRHSAGLSATSSVEVHNYAPENKSRLTQFPALRVSPLAAGSLTRAAFRVGAGVPLHARYVGITQAEIRRSVTWEPLDVPYRFYPDQEIAAATKLDPPVVLKLQPGVVVQVSVSGSLYVGSDHGGRGDLVAVGTAALPVTFTSSEDSPAPGDWPSIVFVPPSYDPKISRIDHARIEYGGASGMGLLPSCRDHQVDVGALLSFAIPSDGLNYAGPRISHTTFRRSGGNAIRGACSTPNNCLLTDYTDEQLANSFADFVDQPSQLALGCP